LDLQQSIALGSTIEDDEGDHIKIEDDREDEDFIDDSL